MSVLSALAESGQLSSAVLASLPGTAVVVFDRDLRYRLVAGQALERHGWRGEEFEGRTMAEVLPPELVAELEPHYRAALEGNAVRVDHTSFDGTAIYRTDVAPLRHDGEIVAGIVIARDITEAHAANAKLEASEQRYRLLAEHATDVISRHAPDGTILYVSPSVRELLGVEPESLVGTNALDLHHLEDVAANREIWRSAFLSPVPRKGEYRIRRADGGYSWVEATVRRAGDAGEVVAVTRDVTERKRGEEVALEAHARFEAAFRHAPIGKAIVGLDGRCLKVNHALRELTGYSNDELLGKTLQELTHPDDIHLDAEDHGRLISGLTRSYRVEKRFIRADGQELWVALSASLVRDRHGRPLHLIAQIQDIAEQRSHVERLQELDRLKDEFIGFVSHELRTPLTSIQGYVDLLMEFGDNLDAEQRGFLETVQRNGARLNRLIEDLLAYLRMEDGQVELHVDRVDLAALVAESGDSAGPAAERKQLTLATSLGSEAPVLGDEGRLAQVVDNLLSNAIKYTPDGGEIEVSVGIEDEQAVLIVSDTGIGIPAAELPRLFERFFRSSTATERGITGTGLGLAITKGLVEAHGGTIAAERLERGTRFVVALPLAPMPVAAALR